MSISNKKIILASESKLRKMVLEASRLDFETIAPEIDEYVFDNLAPDERVMAVAEAKCNKIIATNKNQIVVAADTITYLKNNPDISEDKRSTKSFKASQLLSETIVVVTAVAFYSPGDNIKLKLFKTEVDYGNASEDNLNRLLKGDDRKMRSGSLGIYIDSPGFGLAKNVRGSYTGLFGLDLSFLYECLEDIDYFSES